MLETNNYFFECLSNKKQNHQILRNKWLEIKKTFLELVLNNLCLKTKAKDPF